MSCHFKYNSRILEYGKVWKYAFGCYARKCRKRKQQGADVFYYIEERGADVFFI